MLSLSPLVNRTIKDKEGNAQGVAGELQEINRALVSTQVCKEGETGGGRSVNLVGYHLQEYDDRASFFYCYSSSYYFVIRILGIIIIIIFYFNFIYFY